MLPDTNEGILFIVGALFFLIGLIGGGLEISAIKIPPVSKAARFFVLIVGTFLMTASMYRFLAPEAPLISAPTPESTPTDLPTPIPSETAVPTNTEPAAPTATSQPTETAAPTTTTGSARIDDIRVDFDVIQFGRDGMLIHIDFVADGLEGVPCQAVAYFYFDSGEALVDHNGAFNTVDNKVATFSNFTPIYPSAEFNDFTLFMPYEELELPNGEYMLKFSVSLFDASLTQLTTAPDFEFTYTQ